MKFDYSFQSGFIIGYVASAVLVIAIFMYVKRRNKLMMARHKKKRKETDRISKLPRLKLQQEVIEEIFMLETFVAQLRYTDLSNSTGNFSQDNIIGLGKMGTMYKAILPGGLVLAVQRLHDSQLSSKHFMSEILTIGRLRHTNLVPLLAFCQEGKERLLVYKYMSNGNLYDWLQHSKVGATTMEWPVRAKIAIGLARGLARLHQCCNLHVIYLNISSKCILLDENFESKISNSGRAIFMCPNDIDLSKTFFANSVLRKSLVMKDVFEFGVVLLELITGEDSIKNMFSFHCLLWTLVDKVNHLSSSSAVLYDAVDKSLIGQGFDVEILHFLKIACDCVQSPPDQRPSMLKVYKMLKAFGERNGLSNDYEISMQNEIVPADSGDECIELN